MGSGCSKEGGCCDNLGIICYVFLFCLGIVGLVFSLLAIASCEFFKFENNISDWYPSGVDGQIGLFRGQVSENQTCATYPDDLGFDGYARTGRSCAVLAPLFSVVSLILMTIEFACCKYCGSRILISFFYFCAWVCQGLSFSIFGTEQFCNEASTKCSLGDGGIYAIVAVSVWMVASCVVCCSPRPEPLMKRECKAKCCKKVDEEDVEKGHDGKPEHDDPDKSNNGEPEPASAKTE